MAIAFARPKYVSRSTGANACCKSAYNARAIVKDERSNNTYNFVKRGGNVYHEMLLPEHVDSKFKNIAMLSNEVERNEHRKDSQLFVEWLIALPKEQEVTLEMKLEIIHRFIEYKGWTKEGLGVQIDIHEPHENDINWHAHLLVTTRRFTKDGLGFEELKARDLNPKVVKGAVVEETLDNIAIRDIQNKYFKECGLDLRVDLPGEITQEHIGPVRMRSILNEAVLRNEKRVIANIESLKTGEDVVDRIIKTNSVFSKNDLVRVVKCVPDLDRRIQLVNDAMSLKNIVELYDEEGKSSGFFTTIEVRREEEKLLRISSNINEQPNISHENNRVFAQTKLTNELSSHQQEAFEYLMLSDKGLRILQGRAGTGKSRVLGHIAKVAHDNNLPILGLAPTHKAKIELESVGFKNSDTIKRFLFKLYNDKATLPKNSIIVIDEAGMVGNSDYSELLRVAHKQDCNVILAGDERQLSSMSRGGMFEVFAQKYGSIELSDIRRQSEQWGKDVAQMFSSGNVREGVAILRENERISIDADKVTSIATLLSDWDNSAVDVDKRLIIAIKNKDVDVINEGARALLKAKGQVESKEYVLTKSEHGEHRHVSFSTGDRVVFNASNKELNISNGDFGKLTCINENQFRVKLDSGGEDIVFNPNEFSGFKHGYASTIYKAQGATIRDVYVLHDGFAGLKNSYVAMSRHVEDLHLYVNKISTSSFDALIRQLSVTDERKSSLAFFTKDELEAQKQIEPTGIFGKVGAIIGKQYTKLIDKRVNDEYYNYKRPIVASAKVEEMLLLVNEHMEARIDEIRDANIAQKFEQAVMGSDIKKATPKQRFYSNVEYQRSKAAQTVSTRGAYAANVERLREIAKDKCELIAEHLLGAPNKHLSDRQTLRFGENGSIAVQIKGSKAGTWYDFSSTKGGDMFSLVQEVESCNFKDSVASLTSFLGVERSSHLKLVYDISSRDKYIDYNKQTHQEKAIELARIRKVEKLIEQAQPIERDSVAHRYLSDTRKIDTALSEDIQTTYIYDARTKEKLPAIIAFARNSQGEITGGQQILLDPHTAHKSNTSAVPKKSFGKISGSFVEIAPRKNETQPTIIAEGLETGLSIKAAGVDAHIICSLGVSNIKNYAPQPAERIIIAADNDGVGANSERSIESAALEFSKTSFVRVIKPQELGDFNDILQEQGSKVGAEKIAEIFAPTMAKLSLHTQKDIEIIIDYENRCRDKTGINEFLSKNTKSLDDLVKFNPKYDLSKLTIKLEDYKDRTRDELIKRELLAEFTPYVTKIMNEFEKDKTSSKSVDELLAFMKKEKDFSVDMCTNHIEQMMKFVQETKDYRMKRWHDTHKENPNIIEDTRKHCDNYVRFRKVSPEHMASIVSVHSSKSIEALGIYVSKKIENHLQDYSIEADLRTIERDGHIVKDEQKFTDNRSFLENILHDEHYRPYCQHFVATHLSEINKIDIHQRLSVYKQSKQIQQQQLAHEQHNKILEQQQLELSTQKEHELTKEAKTPELEMHHHIRM